MNKISCSTNTLIVKLKWGMIISALFFLCFENVQAANVTCKYDNLNRLIEFVYENIVSFLNLMG